MLFRKKGKADIAATDTPNIDPEVKRNLQGSIWGKILATVAVSMSLFHFFLVGFGSINPMLLRSIHLSFAATLIFLLKPAAKFSPKKRPSVLDLIFIGIFWVSSIYLVMTFGTLAQRAGSPSQWDVILGILICLLVLEITRRAAGMILTVLGALFLLYTYAGPYLPGLLAHRGFGVERIAATMFTTTDGLFGVTLGVSATYIFFFMLFGSFLESMGAGKFFIDIAFSVAGRKKGGPAQTMVAANGLMSMISGTPAADVVTIGALTFPLLEKLNYNKIFTSALAAVAASGAMITPPIMGSAAFLMSEMTGIPYREICLSAIGPAILYYISVFAVTHFYAGKYEKHGLPASELPVFVKVLKEGWYYLVPIFTLIYLLVGKGYSPMLCGYYAIWAMVLVVAVKNLISSFRLTSTAKEVWREFFWKIINSLKKAALGSVNVVATCAVAGFLVGALNITGLGLKFSAIIISLANGNLFLTLVFSAFASIILGMGLPIVACYIILAVLVAPALISMGLPPMAAHLFILFFGTFAGITPPVAICAYASAGMNKVSPNKVAIYACWLALSAFIIPFIFVYGQELLVLKGTVLDIVWTFVTATFGVISMSACIMGYFVTNANVVQRIALFVGSLLTIIPGLATDAIGIPLIILVIVWQNTEKKRGAKNGKDGANTSVTIES